MSRSASVFSAQAEAPTPSARISYYARCSANANDVICLPQHDGKLTADGWALDYETWQGVRTSDLTVGQWNTPDAYAGEVHDPMTQKPFMWNHNNPYAYTDPNGYETGNILRGWEGHNSPPESSGADGFFDVLREAVGKVLEAEVPMFRGGLGSASTKALPSISEKLHGSFGRIRMPRPMIWRRRRNG